MRLRDGRGRGAAERPHRDCADPAGPREVGGGAVRPVEPERPNGGACAPAPGKPWRAGAQLDVVAGLRQDRLLEATIDALGEFRIAVIEGDLETENDARRIRAHGVPAVQITTGSACHLDARMVHDALHELPLAESTSCSSRMSAIWFARPASISGNIATSSCCRSPRATTSRRNIRCMFRAADLVLLTKIDMLRRSSTISRSRRRSGTSASSPIRLRCCGCRHARRETLRALARIGLRASWRFAGACARRRCASSRSFASAAAP